MDYNAFGGFKRQHVPEVRDDQEFPAPVRLPFEFIIDFLHDAMKHNIDKIGRRQIVPQYFQLYLSQEDRETRRQYEDILIEELIYGLKTIRDDYFKNERDPLVVEIADDTDLARFEIGVAVQMVYQGVDIHQPDSYTVTSNQTPEQKVVEAKEVDSVTPAREPKITTTDTPESSSDINEPTVCTDPDTQSAIEIEMPTDEPIEDDDLEKRFRFMVDETKGEELAKSDNVVELAVNMSSDDSENDIDVNDISDKYDDTLYQDEEDIDPEILERLKRDRKFYEEWKSRGRVPTLLSRNANRQSERRMGHKEI